jgi:hypothetical protein
MPTRPEIPYILTPIDKRPSEEDERRIENDHEDAVHELYTSPAYHGDIPVNAFSAVAIMNLRKRFKHAPADDSHRGEEIYTRLTFGQENEFLDLSVARREAEAMTTLASGNFADWHVAKLGEDIRVKVFDLSEVSHADDPLAAIAVKLTVGKAVMFDKEIPVVGRHYGIVSLNDSGLEAYERTALKILSIRDKAEDSNHYTEDTFRPFTQDVTTMLEKAAMRHGGLTITPVVESLYTASPIHPPNWRA